MRVLNKLYRICQLTGQVRSIPIFTLLPNNTAQDPQVSPSRTDFPWLQVPHKVAGRSYPSTTGFRGTVSLQPKEVQMKAHADRKKNVKTSDIQVGDAELMKQEPSSKASPP